MRDANDLSLKRSASSYRLSLVKETGAPLKSFKLRLPVNAAEAARHFLPVDLDREIFGVLIVNTRNIVVGHNVISIGSLNGSLVHPREVFKVAIMGSGAAIVCYHNHPSGDPSPSSEDRELTKRIAKAGSLMGIALLDHVILGHAPDDQGMRGEASGLTYWSFKEHNDL